jgi:hypothetical protein
VFFPLLCYFQNLLGVMYKIVEGETPALPEKFHPEFRKIFNGWERNYVLYVTIGNTIIKFWSNENDSWRKFRRAPTHSRSTVNSIDSHPLLSTLNWFKFWELKKLSSKLSLLNSQAALINFELLTFTYTRASNSRYPGDTRF